MRVLRLYARPADVASHAGGAAAGAPASADEVCARSLPELVKEAALRRGGYTLLGPIGEVLLLDQLAAEAGAGSGDDGDGASDGGGLRGMAGTAGLLRSLQRFCAAAGYGAVQPQTLARAGQRLGRSERNERGGPAAGRQMARVLELARLLRRYRALLGRRFLDAGLMWQLGLGALAESPPPEVRDADLIEIHGLHRPAEREGDGGPTPHGLMAAVAALARTGKRVEVVLPQVTELAELQPSGDLPLGLDATEPEAVLALALGPLVDALHRHHTLDLGETTVPLGPFADAATPWGRFLAGLFQSPGAPPLLVPGELSDESLGFAPLPSPRAEAQHVARAVRDLLDRGVPPSGLAVVVQAPERRARICEALARYRVPVAPLPEAVPPLPPPLLLLLSIYELLEPAGRPGAAADGLPREGLILLLSSSYLRFPGLERPAALVRALRAAGVRELHPSRPAAPELFGAPAPAGSDAEPAWRGRLVQWLRQQAASKKGASGSALPPESRALIEHVETAVRELYELPAEATLSEHCAGLRRLCERLGWFRCCADPPRPATRGDEVSLREALELRAAELLCHARDAAAAAALRCVLDELPLLGRRLGLPAERGPIPRARFAGLLRAALARAFVPPGGTDEGGGVFVGELGRLPTAPRQHLFLTGLLDGELPPRPLEDPVLDDDTRRGLARLLDAPVWPQSQHDAARAPLLLCEALAHCRAAHLSWPVADDEGRPLLRSGWIEAVRTAAGLAGEPPRLRAPLLPWPDAARHPAELWTRATLSRSLQPIDGVPLVAEPPQLRLCAPALLPQLALRERARAGQLRARIAVEQARTRWFTALSSDAAEGLDGLAGPFVGRLGDAALVELLQPRLPGSPKHALSASALEDYAKCPFRFFVRRVLKATPLLEGGEDLDPLASGRLHHAVLERFFLERRDTGHLPLAGGEDDRAALERALDEEIARFSQQERTGHPALFAVRARRLREDLWRLIEREARGADTEQSGPRLLPALFEHHFGPIEIAAVRGADEPDDGMALHIEGIIDRVDIGVGPGGVHAQVLDYKAGRLSRYEELLTPTKLLVTSFQLPLYAAALTVDPTLHARGGPVRVSARYYSLRQGRMTRTMDDAPELISLDPAVRRRAPERNVAEVAYRLWRRLRAGDFRVAPQTCEGCGLEAVCRIRRGAPEAEADAASRVPSSSGSPSPGAPAAPSAASPTPEWPEAVELQGEGRAR